MDGPELFLLDITREEQMKCFSLQYLDLVSIAVLKGFIKNLEMEIIPHETYIFPNVWTVTFKDGTTVNGNSNDPDTIISRNVKMFECIRNQKGMPETKFGIPKNGSNNGYRVLRPMDLDNYLTDYMIVISRFYKKKILWFSENYDVFKNRRTDQYEPADPRSNLLFTLMKYARSMFTVEKDTIERCLLMQKMNSEENRPLGENETNLRRDSQFEWFKEEVTLTLIDWNKLFDWNDDGGETEMSIKSESVSMELEEAIPEPSIPIDTIDTRMEMINDEDSGMYLEDTSETVPEEESGRPVFITLSRGKGGTHKFRTSAQYGNENIGFKSKDSKEKFLNFTYSRNLYVQSTVHSMWYEHLQFFVVYEYGVYRRIDRKPASNTDFNYNDYEYVDNIRCLEKNIATAKRAPNQSDEDFENEIAVQYYSLKALAFQTKRGLNAIEVYIRKKNHKVDKVKFILVIK